MTKREIEISLLELCKQGARKHKEPEMAIQAVRAMLATNPKLRHSLWDELEYRAVASGVYQARHLTLGQIKANLPCYLNNEAGMQAVAQAAILGLDAWIMPDGRPLSVYHRPELLAAATADESKADGYRRNATLYRTIAGRMKSDRVPVNRVISETEFAAMLARIWGKEKVEAVA